MSLIIPAAGRGSRFLKSGVAQPKPLIELNGRPFFWWAVESIRRITPLEQIVFVVLEEHIGLFSIDKIIKAYYPEATIVALEDVTSGAAETARIGLAALRKPGPVAINDCDHAFICHSLSGSIDELGNDAVGDDVAAILMGFRSSSPAYSYIKFNAKNEVEGTIEKQVVSPFAIAGCYIFADSDRFAEIYEQYKSQCPYSELFVSGMFNILSAERATIRMVELDRHCSFGTPEEQALISDELFSPFLAWK